MQLRKSDPGAGRRSLSVRIPRRSGLRTTLMLNLCRRCRQWENGMHVIKYFMHHGSLNLVSEAPQGSILPPNYRQFIQI